MAKKTEEKAEEQTEEKSEEQTKALSPEEIFNKLDETLKPKEEKKEEEPLLGEQPPELEPAPEPAPEEHDFGIPAVAVQEEKKEEDIVSVLRQELAEERKRFDTLLQQKEKPKEVETPTAEQEVQEIASKYNFNVQPDLVEAMQSDDTGVSAGALNSIVLGTALAVHKAVREEYMEKISDLEKRLVGRVNGAAQAASKEEAVNQFYATYPQLNSPAIRPIVQQVAIEQAKKGAVWGEQTMLAIAQQTREVLKASGLTLAKQVAPKETPPFMGGGNSPKNTPESEPTFDPNSPEAIKQFARGN